MSKTITVVGSIALDTVETPYGKKENILGGSCTYFSYAASFFSKVNLVGVVGKDFPQEHVELLNSRNICTKGLTQEEGETFRWGGSYINNINEAETKSTDLNVFESFDPNLPEEYRHSDFVFLANIDPDLQLKVLNQIKNPELIICDTMNLWIDIKKESLTALLKKVDIFILNDGEAKMLSGESNLIKAAKKIVELGPEYVLIKKGEHGALIYSKSLSPEFFMIPSFPVEEVVDPTGAGDTFAGGFTGSLAAASAVSPEAIKESMIYGTTLASFNVEDFSLERMKRLEKEEITNRAESFKKIISL